MAGLYICLLFRFSKMLYYLPNLLTLTRILTTPFLVVFIFQKNKIAFIILLLFAALTDFLDGYTARKFNAISKNGVIFDAVADKILIISVLTGMLMTGYFGIYFLFLLLLRDIVVVIGACILFLSSFNTSLISSVQHSWASKIVTFLQFVTIISIILGIGSFYFLTATVLFGIWASISYIIFGVKLIREKNNL